MAQDNEPIVLSEGEHAAAQTFWAAFIGVVLFAGAAFFILI